MRWGLVGLVLLLAALALIGSAMPRAYEFSAELVIPRTPHQAWSRFVQIERWPEWIPAIRSVEVVGHGPDGLGQRFRLVAGMAEDREISGEIEVTEWMADRRVVLRYIPDSRDNSFSPFASARGRFDFQETAPGSTRITMAATVEVTGLVNRWLARLVYKPLVERTMARSLETIRQRFEAPPTGSSIPGRFDRTASVFSSWHALEPL